MFNRSISQNLLRRKENRAKTASKATWIPSKWKPPSSDSPFRSTPANKTSQSTSTIRPFNPASTLNQSTSPYFPIEEKTSWWERLFSDSPTMPVPSIWCTLNSTNQAMKLKDKETSSGCQGGKISLWEWVKFRNHTLRHIKKSKTLKKGYVHWWITAKFSQKTNPKHQLNKKPTAHPTNPRSNL